ncbi:ABC transporter permease subunit [Pseudarthrobacter psychrotolerans]|uniref:ABC transporter permease subunit n=1 Tax=Pseudarthrobacter psychrotolerans TaxID=2697569 RepID=A0A6P1NE73_9MICC|nr:amino acid ABC transporter permease [Pseudarthrobacter psychrotolerans]QHK18566.1 ABC transporter permease subunit [Pseudarthrobacter psychrotolerans]
MYQWLTVFSYLEEFLQAALLTLEVTLLAFALAVVLAIVAALGRDSHRAVLRLVAGFYVEAIRNTPVLLQIFVAYFAIPAMGINLTAFAAGIIALGVNVGAYLTEVFRAGISSVPTGQIEAAGILGLNQHTIFTRVVLPQALRNVYPAVINNLIQILLGTSLLSAIALPELTGAALTINSRTLIFLPVFAMALVLYLVLSNGLSFVGALIGRVAFKPALVLPKATLGARLVARRAASARKKDMAT